MAWLRLSVTAVSGLGGLASAVVPGLVNLWIGAVAYAALVTMVRPQRLCTARVWWVLTGMIDWTLISAGIVLDGGLQSDFYVLYFALAFGAGVRFGLREAVLCGATTAVSYLVLMLAVTPDVGSVVPVVALRMGYLMAIAVGAGLLAREADRTTRADISYEAEQSAVRDVAGALSVELSNPLAAAAGMVDILLDPSTGSLSAQQRTLLSGLNGNIDHANNLVHNVIAVEKIERSQSAFSPGLGDLNHSVQEVVNSFARLAEEKAVGLVLNLAPALPLVSFDARWLEHALRNVLSNAMQFTSAKGAVRVSTAATDGHLAIEVWNSGAAISPRVARNLFGKFVRDPNSRGIGLGLYVAREILALHRGQISACNAADGVMVTFKLPCPSEQPSLVRLTDDPAWSVSRRPALAN